MLLVIDVGNTQTVVGCWDGSAIVTSARFRSVTERTSDEWGLWIHRFLNHHKIEPASVNAVAMASVVPPTTRIMSLMCQDYFGVTPFIIGPGIRTGMPVLYEDPKAVGADRIANAVAAFRLYGGPCVVIDLGTATTFDVVTRRGEYLGGVIAPGIEISAEALFHRAARLPRVEIQKPPTVVGRNTSASMQSGLYYGYLGLINRIAEEIRQEMGEDTRFVATGGLAPLFQHASPFMEYVEPDLTLLGIAFLFDLNHESDSRP